MMETLTNFINKVFQNAIGKLMAAFGISFVSFTSYQQGLDYVKNGVTGFLNSIPADVFLLVAKSGITDGLGYFVGAATFIVTKNMINRLTFGVFS
jgi:hypothetical protein